MPRSRNERLVRVPIPLLERANALIPSLTASTPPHLVDALRWTETAVVRRALALGMAALEAELAAPEATDGAA